MVYRERISEQESQWIKAQIRKRKEQQKDWAKYLGMEPYFFCKILSQVKPLPERFEDKWNKMKKILEEDEYERF